MPDPWHPKCIIAFAGRRPDAENAEERRFAFTNVPVVRSALTNLFRREMPFVVVASAACGGDLLALDAADALGIHTRVVLPFPPDQFRNSSVVDRPHPEFWGPMFDRLVGKADARGELVVLGLEDCSSAYTATNRAIVNEATSLAGSAAHLRRLAVIAWDGATRGKGDLTQQFADFAQEAGFKLVEVSTLDPTAKTSRSRYS